MESPARKRGLWAPRKVQGSQSVRLAPLWVEGVGWFATGPYFHWTEGLGVKGQEGVKSPALLQAVPTSRSPCPTLEEARGPQSCDNASPTLLGPLQSAIC